ncbi:hypothetical protein [Salipaludibacillus aurantiacus]|uniref:Uncharacterized protein n=1 Tax=Salipaludibacillus aurantiacus TaxID=1601833 RepID=A0A1H9WXV6_9BACI|nr:hypothetical protein [Salipaludibacillus aurantiacus]SES38695.1 hypothetical protein SAMN05518684_12126 [Salipaludibacillus aurantiacus]
MKEEDLLKVILHRLAKIEAKMAKQDDLDEIHEQLFEQDEQIRHISDGLQALKVNLEIRHIENMNSDDVLLRSILDRKSLQYK